MCTCDANHLKLMRAKRKRRGREEERRGESGEARAFPDLKVPTSVAGTILRVLVNIQSVMHSVRVGGMRVSPHVNMHV